MGNMTFFNDIKLNHAIGSIVTFLIQLQVALTTLLVMYTLFQSISSTLPQTAYLKLIDYWLLFSLIFPFIIFIIHVAREIQRIQQDKRAANGQRNGGSSCLSMMSKPVAQIAVPLVTIIFMIGYLSYTIKVCFQSP